MTELTKFDFINVTEAVFTKAVRSYLVKLKTTHLGENRVQGLFLMNSNKLLGYLDIPFIKDGSFYLNKNLF